MKQRITIIGAGLAGSLLAIYLARRGYPVEMYERRPDMRRVQIDGGRSINLALSTRGIHALKDTGLDSRIMQIAIPMRGRMIHSVEGDLSFQPYGKDASEVIYATSRAQLNMALMDEAEKCAEVRIHFNARCSGMNFETGEFTLQDERTRQPATVTSNTLIAADGASSAVRMEMQTIGRFNLSQQYLEYGYKELTIPAGPGGRHLLEKNALHIWPRGSFMLIALPNIDGSFTCTFFFPFEGDVSFAALESEDKVLAFFREHFPDAIQLMPDFMTEYQSNPTGSMVTIKCEPWHVGGRVLLLGDAAHAIVPFFGQGMNCAFEDCTYLDECIGKSESVHGMVKWEKVFSRFEQLRRENTDAIADLAVENFVEMRDHVAHPNFLFKKKVELALEKKYPDIFIPKYSMVTFHRVPYAVARQRGKIQDRILSELCDGIDRLEDLNWESADLLITTSLDRL